MWEELANWWQFLWSDQKVAAGVIGGFISAFLVFLIKDAIWQTRVARLQAQRQSREKNLQVFYAPLYRIFREGYARFDQWKMEHPETLIARRAFFDSDIAESAIAALFNDHAECASPQLIGLWAEAQAVTDAETRASRRHELVVAVVREYHDLRRALHMQYDRTERETGQFAENATS